MGASPDDPLERRPRGTRGAPPRGSRALTAILPNGRTVWIEALPALAPAGAANHVAALAEHSTRWRRAATQANGDALAQLAQRVDDDAERIIDAAAERKRSLRRRFVREYRRVDRKLSKAAEQHQAALDKQMRIERETVRRLGRRSLWDSILLATGGALFAAYAQRGRAFGVNHIVLTLLLLIWLVGDEVVDALFGAKDKSPYPLRDTDAWSYLAPVGNVLAAWWLLRDLQHERFVAGSTAIPADAFTAGPNPAAPPALLYRYEVQVDLAPNIGPTHVPDFQTFTDVPVVATIASAQISPAGVAANAVLGPVTARVETGVLILAVGVTADDNGVVPIPSVLDAIEVAWMVDTADPASAQ